MTPRANRAGAHVSKKEAAFGPPPAVADVDGDGALEILAGTRRGAWAVLNTNGEILTTVPAEGGSFGSRLVADIDGDGILEVVDAAGKGVMTCYSFGGAETPGAVLYGDWRGPENDLGNLRNRAEKKEDYPQAPKDSLRFGKNLHACPVPASLKNAALEVSTLAPDGVRETELFRVPKNDQDHSTLSWSCQIMLPRQVHPDLALVRRGQQCGPSGRRPGFVHRGHAAEPGSRIQSGRGGVGACARLPACGEKGRTERLCRPSPGRRERPA